MSVCTLVILTAALVSVSTESISLKTLDVVNNYQCAADSFRFANAKPATCTDPSFGRKMKITCSAGGVVELNGDPRSVHLDRPLATDDKLIITGTPTEETAMYVSLFSGDDIVLHLVVRIDMDGQNDVVAFNSNLGGSWGLEETYTDDFPFDVDTEFNTVIVAKVNEYEIGVNDGVKYTFAFREPSPSVTMIQFRGDIKINTLIRD